MKLAESDTLGRMYIFEDQSFQEGLQNNFVSSAASLSAQLDKKKVVRMAFSFSSLHVSFQFSIFPSQVKTNAFLALLGFTVQKD